ncbi:DNA-directed RNA polymerase III complex subunit Rpc25 [Mucor velutinosus]|uniref:DNA-directed RNA polymerase III complex subunit Rpc25 n=1 Tax=Mucor velutinosus TaxID=708070 RepID=A0AAN7D7R4_9FUNG|nr:DNA-directed RNA polymerase III complex subunit Rpc25 [Mucor velutinosus]
MKLTLALLLVVYCILAASMPESISQDGITESGPFKNKVSGSGSSAQTFSQSTTEYTTTDGRTLSQDPGSFQL